MEIKSWIKEKEKIIEKSFSVLTLPALNIRIEMVKNKMLQSLVAYFYTEYCAAKINLHHQSILRHPPYSLIVSEMYHSVLDAALKFRHDYMVKIQSPPSSQFYVILSIVWSCPNRPLVTWIPHHHSTYSYEPIRFLQTSQKRLTNISPAE